MQLQREVGGLGGEVGCDVDRDLIELDLLGALAGDALVRRGIEAKIFARNRRQLVFHRGAVQHIRLEHGVEFVAAQLGACAVPTSAYYSSMVSNSSPRSSLPSPLRTCASCLRSWPTVRGSAASSTGRDASTSVSRDSSVGAPG